MNVLYDPDFDTSSPSTSGDITNGFTSRTAFFAGIATAVLLVGTIGFFVLLFVILKLKS